MRVFILGGIHEAVNLCNRLYRLGHATVYSVLKSGTASIPCSVEYGPYQSSEDLLAKLIRHGSEMLVDATHPYAMQIKQQAWQACQQLHIPLWRYHRPAWQAEKQDLWIIKENMSQVMHALLAYQRPLFAVGRQALAFLDQIESRQYWTIRCLQAADSGVGDTKSVSW